MDSRRPVRHQNPSQESLLLPGLSPSLNRFQCVDRCRVRRDDLEKSLSCPPRFPLEPVRPWVNGGLSGSRGGTGL